MPGVAYGTSYGTPRLDLAMAYMEYMFNPAKLIGTKLFTPLAVPRKTATFPRRVWEDLLQRGTDIKRAPRAPYERDGVKFEDDTYECEERGHETPVDQSEAAFYQEDFDLERHSFESSLFKVLIDQEIDIAAQAFDGTTNFTVANGRRTDVATAWSNAAAPIIGDVQTAKESIRQRRGVMPDTLCIGAGVLPFFIKNTEFRASIGIATGGVLSVDAILNALKLLLGLPKILVGEAVYNSANKELTAGGTITDVWSNIWALVCKTADDGAPVTDMAIGRTMFWVEDGPSEGALAEEYVEPQTRSKVMRARNHADEKVLDLDLGQLLDIAG